MKTPVLLLLAVTLAAWPGSAQAKRRKSGGDSDAHLPPKNPMLQLTPPDGGCDPAPRPAFLRAEWARPGVSHHAVDAGRTQVAFCKVAKEKAESDQIRAVGDALGGTQSQENSYISRLAARRACRSMRTAAPRSTRRRRS